MTAFGTRAFGSVPRPPADRAAWRFVIAIGLVSLFGDFTYEGGRSIVGPYLGQLGASALLIGVIAGGGEFLGYLIRLVSGRAVDRTGRYWPAIHVGFLLNMLALPLIAAMPWLGAAGTLVFLERLGKGLRTPARDAVLARGGGQRLGHGKAFGVHEAMDQTGAVLGPLVVAAAVGVVGAYRPAFGILAVPAVICLALLYRAHSLEPQSSLRAVDAPTPARAPEPGSSGIYWHYVAFAALTVVGFAHFQLAAFRLQDAAVVPAAAIPLLFAVAMAADAVLALAAGYLYDRAGLRVLVVLPLFAGLGTGLLFLGDTVVALTAGAFFWGGALGMQEGTMRAAVADLTPAQRRASAYGLFDAVFGASWLGGSVLFGVLYAWGQAAIVGVSLAAEAAAIVLLVSGPAWRLRSGRSASEARR